MRKATFIIGFGAGYVLGAKAGRTRYEQIMRQTRSFLGKPAVQDATHAIKEQAESALGSAKKVVTQKVLRHDDPVMTNGSSYAGMSGAGRVDPYPA